MKPKFKVGDTVQIINNMSSHGKVTVIEHVIRYPSDDFSDSDDFYCYQLSGMLSRISYGPSEFREYEIKLYTKLDKILE